MQRDESDNQIIGRYKAGDKEAFNLLLLRYQARIYKLVLKFVGTSMDAGDITQEVFLKAYLALAGFQGKSHFYTWLYRIAVNTCKNHLQANQRSPVEHSLESLGVEKLEQLEPTQVDDNPENLRYTEELEELLHNSIESLAPELKTALWLREVDGHSYEGIAQHMHCPIGTVRSRISRARQAIEKTINRQK